MKASLSSCHSGFIVLWQEKRRRSSRVIHSVWCLHGRESSIPLPKKREAVRASEEQI